MSAALVVCLGLAAAAAAVTWRVAFGLAAARTDRLGTAVLAGLVGHLDQFEADLGAEAVAVLAAAAPGGGA